MNTDLTVQQINLLFNINIWKVKSFRADVRIDFDEYGNVLEITLLDQKEEPDEH